uniref:Uncharacterized protein n=1 Tax=Arundo donax TaxID=35708 RepID=A0A0A9FBY9_ARUDO
MGKPVYLLCSIHILEKSPRYVIHYSIVVAFVPSDSGPLYTRLPIHSIVTFSPDK